MPSRLHTRYCGDATRPQISLWAENTTLDHHNEIHFNDCFFVYPLGHNIRIGGTPANPSKTRIIFFHGCIFHGLTGGSVSREAPTRHLSVHPCII